VGKLETPTEGEYEASVEERPAETVLVQTVTVSGGGLMVTVTAALQTGTTEGQFRQTLRRLLML
jgi:hypothetical protein